MELTRRGFIAGAGVMASGMVCGAHAYSDRLRGSLRSGDTGDRAQPNAREKTSVASHDPNLLAFLSDIHLLDNTVRWNDGPVQSSVVLPQLVSEILALRPLPANAVVFGDFSASCGWEEDFRLAAACLKPLSDAGIVLSFAMGNHDNRASFLKVFPDYKTRLLLPERIVSKVSTPNADIILLDTLKSRPGREWAEPDKDGNLVEGTMDGAQREWLRDALAAATRPTFIGAHHRAQEPGIVKEVVNASNVYGYIFGHEHVVAEGFLHDGYVNSRTVQTATLPSGGYWGDIGYALFRTFEDRAELTFRQTDFYFNRLWQDRPRPKNWRERVRMHDGRTMTFWYDKPGNFYEG